MITILIENHPALKDLHIPYGWDFKARSPKSVHFLKTFAKYADRLGSNRSAEWSHNLMVGLNHGYISDNRYLSMMLDLLQDEYDDLTH